MSDISIVIADTSTAYAKNIAAFFCTKSNIRIAAICKSGPELIKAVRMHRPDAVLMDIVLEHTDGLSVLKHLRLDFKDTVFIICSEFASETCVTRAARYGATAFICKPADRLSLYETITESVSIMRERSASNAESADRLDAAISDMLLEIGISSGSEGFRLFRYAAKYFVRSGSGNISMTKQLYPELARIFGSTAARIERNMRSAVARAYTKGTMMHCIKRPTNKELIMMIVSGISSTDII